jgi:transposase
MDFRPAAKGELLQVPEQTRLAVQASFPKGTPYILLHDELGTLFTDKDFLELFPTHGRPAYSPWRLALMTILRFRENLSDRQAAEAIRSRIDWKYLLALEPTDSGFDYSVLTEFRSRLPKVKKKRCFWIKYWIN